MQGAALPMFALLLGAWAPQLCWAHGKLTQPTPRDGISAGRAGLDENNPVSFEPGCTQENTCDAFVCREAAPNPNVPVKRVVAGQSLTLGWMFAALHVGDCAVYISYDVDAPRSQQRYVKIANLPDCKSYSTWSIKIPEILPAGRAILRWDWVALHVWPKPEMFVQCVDVDIQSSSSTQPSDLDSFSITNPPIYPDDGNDGVGYRNAFGGTSQDMTGPSCIDGSINDCWLTAPGTARNTDSRRGSGSSEPVIVPGPQPAPATPTQAPAPQPEPQPQPVPVPAPPPAPVPAPAPAPGPAAPAPSGSCVSSGTEYYESACAALAATCEQHSFCKRVPAGGSTPAAAPPQGACVSNDPDVDYSAACAALEATCEQFSFCKRAPALAQSSALHSAPRVSAARRLRQTHGSPHHVLLQQESLMQRDTLADDEELDGVEDADEDHSNSVASKLAHPSDSEL